MRISDWSSDVCSSDLHQRARAIARVATLAETPVRRWTQRVDAVVLHPVAGFLILLALMFVMFQAVYAWSEAPIGWIEDGIAALQVVAADALPDGFLRGLIVDGLLAGGGAGLGFRQIGRARGRERGCQ